MAITIDKIQRMLDLQNKLNIYTNGDNWTTRKDIKWLRAAWIECAEMMNHCAFKWWKKQTPNLPQARIELVDIFHFLLSQAICDDIKAEDLMLCFREDIKEEERNELCETPLEWTEELARCILDEGVFSNYYVVFSIVCDELGLPFDELYRLYIGKNVLNIFRQDHGYQQGTYIKQWKSCVDPSGLIEDNVYLDIFMNEALKDEPEDVYTYLYEKLEKEYSNNV